MLMLYDIFLIVILLLLILINNFAYSKSLFAYALAENSIPVGKEKNKFPVGIEKPTQFINLRDIYDCAIIDKEYICKMVVNMTINIVDEYDCLLPNLPILYTISGDQNVYKGFLPPESIDNQIQRDAGQIEESCLFRRLIFKL